MKSFLFVAIYFSFVVCDCVMGRKKWQKSWVDSDFYKIKQAIITHKDNAKFHNLEDIDMSWCSEGPTELDFNCKHCGTKKLSTGGVLSIAIHFLSKAHQEITNIKRTSRLNLKPKSIESQNAPASTITNDSEIAIAGGSQVVEVNQEGGDNNNSQENFKKAVERKNPFQLNKDISFAEIIWTIFVAKTNTSINSLKELPIVIKLTIKDSEIAQKMTLSKYYE